MPLRVLMFGWEFPPHNSGGLGTACLGLTRALSREDIDVVFVLPKKVPVTTQHTRVVFADVHPVTLYEVSSALTPYMTAQGYERFAYGEVDTLYGPTLLDEVKRYAKRAREIAQQETFDIIHAHDWLSFLAGIEAKRISGKPLVVHMHATEFDRTGGQRANTDVSAIEQFGMEQADRVIAVSNFTKQKIVATYGIHPEKITVVHNGIDREDHAGQVGALKAFRSNGAKVVLFTGRLTVQKGPEYFIRAAKRVLDFCPNTVFVIAGSGDMEYSLMREAAALHIADKVLFVGFVRGDELDSLYRTADLFVMPSVSEPFGITPLEAVMNGTPVLVSKQSGIAEVLSHALKADFWDIDEMANKIVSVLRHDTLREVLRETSGREVAGLSWREAAQKCIGVYRDLFVAGASVS
ncbi:MAG: glycosyltransferase family 4 protein [Minisyncoccota bacterium]